MRRLARLVLGYCVCYELNTYTMLATEILGHVGQEKM